MPNDRPSPRWVAPIALLAFVLSSSSFAACGGGGDDVPEGEDAAVVRRDGGVPRDAFTPTDARPFGGLDTGPASIDSGPRDGGDVDANFPACEYAGVEDRIVRCGDAYRFVTRFVSEMPGCTTFFGVDPEGERYEGFAQAAAGAGCSASCLWRFVTGVSRIYCGRRDGYESLEATESGCMPLFRFADGYYGSVEEHDAAHPCP